MLELGVITDVVVHTLKLREGDVLSSSTADVQGVVVVEALLRSIKLRVTEALNEFMCDAHGVVSRVGGILTDSVVNELVDLSVGGVLADSVHSRVG